MSMYAGRSCRRAILPAASALAAVLPAPTACVYDNITPAAAVNGCCNAPTQDPDRPTSPPKAPRKTAAAMADVIPGLRPPPPQNAHVKPNEPTPKQLTLRVMPSPMADFIRRLRLGSTLMGGYTCLLCSWRSM